MYTYGITTLSPGRVWVTPAAATLVEKRCKIFCNAAVSQVARVVALELFFFFFNVFHVAYL